MNSSIKYLSTTALVLLCYSAMLAQRGGPGPNPEKMAERQTSHMVQELNLNDEQATKLKEINLTYATKMHEIRERNKEKMETMREMDEAIRADKSVEMKEILSDEQYKAYLKLEATQSKRRKGKRRKGGE